MCRERLFLAACADETSANRYIPRNRIETIIINDRSRWFSIGTARSIPRFKLTTPARLPMEISGTVTNDRFPFIYLMSIKLVHDRPIAVHEAHKYVTNSANNINFTRKIDILVSTDNKIPSFFNSYIYIYWQSPFSLLTVYRSGKKISLQRPFVERNTSPQVVCRTCSNTFSIRLNILDTPVSLSSQQLSSLLFKEVQSKFDSSFCFFFFFALLSKLFGPYTS